MCDLKPRTLSGSKVKLSVPFTTVRNCIERRAFDGRSNARWADEKLEAPFPSSLYSPRFPAAFVKKRIKSGNEGCKAPGSFLPRQSHSAGSFALSLWAIERGTPAIAPVNPSKRNALSAPCRNFRVNAWERSISSLSISEFSVEALSRIKVKFAEASLTHDVRS